MTRNELKSIFSTFRDLNLAFLAEDLRRKRVAVSAWLNESGWLCPLAHGWDSCRYSVRMGKSFDPMGPWRKAVPDPMRKSGWDDFAPSKLGAFPSWWDDTEDAQLLLSVVEEIQAERLADADAVQAVIVGDDGWAKRNRELAKGLVESLAKRFCLPKELVGEVRS